jgi:ABC-type phosphate transport system permease subunit
LSPVIVPQQHPQENFKSLKKKPTIWLENKPHNAANAVMAIIESVATAAAGAIIAPPVATAAAITQTKIRKAR